MENNSNSSDVLQQLQTGVRGGENECSSTSHEDNENGVNMTTAKTITISSNLKGGFGGGGQIDVSSTSEDLSGVDNNDDGEMCIDMSMTGPISSSNSNSNSNNVNGLDEEEDEMNENIVNDDGIESPEELTIDENLEVEEGGGHNENSVEKEDEEEEVSSNNVNSRSPPQSPPSEVETNDVSQSNNDQESCDHQVIASPSPPSSPPQEETITPSSPVSVSIDENRRNDEHVETTNESFDIDESDLVIAENNVAPAAPLEDEDVEMKEDKDDEVREIQEISSPVPEDSGDSPVSPEAVTPVPLVVPTATAEDSCSNNADTPSSPSPESPPKTENDLRIEEMSSAQSPDNMEMDSSDPVDPQRMGDRGDNSNSLDLDDVSIEKTVTQVDLISSPAEYEKGDESSPDSPEDELMRGSRDDKLDDSISYDDCSSREPKSPDGLNGTPVSSVLEEESQSQSSLPPPEDIPDKGKQSEPKKAAKSAPTEDIDEEDLEDGEIMDEEEEKDDEESVKAVTPPPVAVKSKSSSKEKEKSKDKESSSKSKDTSSKESSSKRKQHQKEESVNNDTLDPVKRLLAEVKERDKSEKEKEREKRRREKKRSREDKKEEERQTKKKKRKMSEEEEEGAPGEEFLLVRGASPSEENWEEFGNAGDDRRGKSQRRRDSEGSGSPQNRHHNRRPEVEASPIRGRPGSDRGKRREPKSDVICAYFMQGKCQKSGDECNFSHDAIPPRKMELCKFWMMECCAKKEKCLYLHNDFPCKFYHTGLVCRQGDRCKFSHNPLNEGTKGVLLKHIETAPKEILGDFPRLNRQGALNLINKMEAKIKGVPYIEEPEDNHGGGGGGHMNHGPPHGHGGPPPHHHHGHGPPDRHGPPHHGHDRSRGDRGHYGGPPQHDNHRGRGDRDRGPPPPQDRGDRRQSRWEQSQPTKDDQHKLQELMNEAGISGYYKDSMESNNSNQQGMPPSQGQQNVFPPQMQNLQAPLLPLLPQFLPGMLPQAAAQNPALATVLASLNIPASSIPPNALSQFGSALIDSPPGSQGSQALSQNSQQGSQEEPKGDANASADAKNSAIPDNLPKMQRELFLRIQQQQLKNENKLQTQEKEPEEPEENWYSDDEEEDTKKKEELKAEINDQISSVLSQIRQQSQQQQQQHQPASSTAPKETTEGTKNFFGDTDLRSSAPSAATDFKDVDLRTSNIFKKINILPATEINASLSSHGPMVYKVMVVAGLRDRPDYSQVRQTLTASAILLDPRLGPKRSNSIPTPASPTDNPSEVGGLSQPLSIPDGAAPVFDPRMRSGGVGSQNTPGQNQMMPDNSLLCSMNMNDFNNPFNRDPRGGPAGGGGPQGGAGGPGGLSNNANANQQQQQQAAQNLALAAAAAAMMQQQWPNGQPPFDPNLFMLAGLPFLPQAPPPVTTTSQGQNPNMQSMEFGNSLLGNPGMRFRPPFMNQPPQQQQQQQQQHPPQQQPPPSSSWERFRQGQGGGLSPPL